MSNNLVTEARVEAYADGEWELMPGKDGAASETIPAAIVSGQGWRRFMLTQGAGEPVRVVDSAGNVVQQWGRT